MTHQLLFVFILHFLY